MPGEVASLAFLALRRRCGRASVSCGSSSASLGSFLTCCGRLAQPARIESARASQVLRMAGSYQAEFAPMHARRPIRSFVLRAGRVTAAQERALAELWPILRRGFRRRAARPRRALRASRAALSRDRIRRRRGDRRSREGAPGDRSSRHRGASGGRGSAVAAARRRKRSRICASSVTTPSRCSRTRSRTMSFDSILIFFPDPWHKKRHHKRRLIDAPFVGHAGREAASPAACCAWRPTGKPTPSRC